MSDATTINGWLEGSPYLVPTDAPGEELASQLLEEQLKVHTRHRDVLAVFLDRTDAVRREIEHDFDVRLVHESNAIEGAGTTFEETRELFRHPIDQATSAVSFSMGVEADPKLLEVLGHRTALQFVRELTTNLQFGQLREVDIRNIHRLTCRLNRG
jgi:Fic family protein